MIKVLPAEGKKIRDPVTHLYVDATDGLEVNEKDLYWYRRLRDGDVVAADAAPPPDGGEGNGEGEGGAARGRAGRGSSRAAETKPADLTGGGAS
jgi:Protein of unknown function (DUF2635)